MMPRECERSASNVKATFFFLRDGTSCLAAFWNSVLDSGRVSAWAPREKHRQPDGWVVEGVSRFEMGDDFVRAPKKYRLILPLGLRVLVSVMKDEDRTEAGLYLPAGAKENHDEALYGQVIEVARDKPNAAEEGENVSGVPNGSQVLFRKDAGVRVPWDEQLRILDVKDILATVEEHSEDETH